MKFNQTDLTHATNLVTALKKAKFELDGLEVLAFAEMLKWVGGLHKHIKESLELANKPMQVVQAPVVAEEPKAEPTVPAATKPKTKKAKQ